MSEEGSDRPRRARRRRAADGTRASEREADRGTDRGEEHEEQRDVGSPDAASRKSAAKAKRSDTGDEVGASDAPSGKRDAGPTTSGATFESVRRPLVASAVAAAIGLAIVGTSPSSIGPWVLAAGVIGLIASIHRLGRLGSA